MVLKFISTWYHVQLLSLCPNEIVIYGFRIVEACRNAYFAFNNEKFVWKNSIQYQTNLLLLMVYLQTKLIFFFFFSYVLTRFIYQILFFRVDDSSL